MHWCSERFERNNSATRLPGDDRATGILLSFVLLILTSSSLFSPTRIHAQSDVDSTTSPVLRAEELGSVSLYPASGRQWIGFERGTLATRIVLYDSSFSEIRQALWGGFSPIDFAAHFREDRTRSAGLVLGLTRNRITLYELDFADLRLVPLWEAEESGELTGILSVAGTGILVHGPRGVALIDTTMKTRAEFDGELLLPPLPVGPDSLLLLHRDATGIHARWTSVHTLDRGYEITLGRSSNRSVVCDMSQVGGPSIVQVALQDPGIIVTIGPETRTVEQVPLPVSSPDFLARAPVDPTLPIAIPVVVSIDYPGPRIYSANHPDGHTLHYPLLDPPLGIVSDGTHQILYTLDSIVLYDADFEYRNVQAWSGGGVPRLLADEDSSGEILISGRDGTTKLDLRREGIDVLRKYGPSVALFLALLLLLVSGILVTERYRRMRAIFRTLVTGTSAEGVMIFSKRGRLIRVNRQALHMLGLPESTPLGRNILSYFRRPDLQDVLLDLRLLLASGIPVDRQVSIEYEDGTRTIRILVRRMTGRYGSNRGILVGLEDLTESVERDRLLNWASVAHHIAHEMKTPLGTIRTTADLLRGELVAHGAGDAPLSMLGRIIRQGARLREIVEDLLTVARSDSLVLNRVDLVLLLRAIADDMREYLPPTCRISVESPVESFTVHADADQLSVALRNVLDNARQAIGTRENGLIACGLQVEGEVVRISIEDNGIGMSEETRRRLFQPFFSEKEGGSGIGTTILKRVIEGHGGRIEVWSEAGTGTRFDLLLPVGEAEA